MDEHVTTKPAPRPSRARPWRRRRHQPLDHPHVAHRIAGDINVPTLDGTTEHVVAPTTGSGGSSGRGPIDDDGGGRKPDRNDDDARFLLLTLGLIALGATVVRAGRLAKARPRRTA